MPQYDGENQEFIGQYGGDYQEYTQSGGRGSFQLLIEHQESIEQCGGA